MPSGKFLDNYDFQESAQHGFRHRRTERSCADSGPGRLRPLSLRGPAPDNHAVVGVRGRRDHENGASGVFSTAGARSDVSEKLVHLANLLYRRIATRVVESRQGEASGQNAQGGDTRALRGPWRRTACPRSSLTELG